MCTYVCTAVLERDYWELWYMECFHLVQTGVVLKAKGGLPYAYWSGKTIQYLFSTVSIQGELEVAHAMYTFHTFS